MNLLLFLALLVLAGIIIFILQNPAEVVVKFIIWQTQGGTCTSLCRWGFAVRIVRSF